MLVEDSTVEVMEGGSMLVVRIDLAVVRKDLL